MVAPSHQQSVPPRRGWNSPLGDGKSARSSRKEHHCCGISPGQDSAPTYITATIFKLKLLGIVCVLSRVSNYCHKICFIYC